jgi:hypothetical protein
MTKIVLEQTLIDILMKVLTSHTNNNITTHIVGLRDLPESEKTDLWKVDLTRNKHSKFFHSSFG